MEKINDAERLSRYMEHYGLLGLFGQDMLPHMELFYYRKHEAICMAGEEPEYFLLFVEGKAKVYTLLKNGKSLMLRFYHPFKLIGDVELMLRTPISSCIQAITPVYCIGIRMGVVKERCMGNPVFLSNIAESLAYKLATFSKSSSINQLYSLENKLAAYILGSLKESDAANPTFECNLSQLSELLGTSYRHLLRTFKKLAQQGILLKQGNCYSVLNSTALEELSADLYE